MSRMNLKDIKTEKDLQIALKDLERRWEAASCIKDSRKRCKEILRLRGEAKHMLNVFRKLDRSANFNDNDDNSVNKMFRNMASWFRIIERKYKDV